MGRYEEESGQKHKANAYDKAVKALASLDHAVTSGAEAAKIDGIGIKLTKKIDEILATGKLQKLEKLKQDPDLAAIRLISRVSGIGPKSGESNTEDQSVNRSQQTNVIVWQRCSL